MTDSTHRIANQPHGKTVADHIYLHATTADHLDEPTLERIHAAAELAGVRFGEDCNVVKLGVDGRSVSLLSYPAFFDEAFPSLQAAWTVDLDSATVRYRTYEQSLNPPILHRKELLLPRLHPSHGEFAAMTATAEQLGLFDDPVRIGFKQAWECLLEQRGYRVSGHQFVPIGNDETAGGSLRDNDSSSSIARHLTALQRYRFSAPIQTLARFGFIDGSRTLFDYGCGRGDDVRGLRQSGIDATGWDPYYAPGEQKRRAHLVNLGFVINVIEDRDERMEALQGAYALSDELLIVSTMIANQDAVQGVRYGDGVLTSRNTFQKYYTQGELGHYLSEVLDEEPLPIAPGIFYVFKDKNAEQRFRMGRQQNRRAVFRLARLSRERKPDSTDRAHAKYEQHRELLESLWEQTLSLGRDPDRTEIEDIEPLVLAFGSAPAALRFLKSRKQDADGLLDSARRSRADDLAVYFAQLQFDRRKPYRHLDSRLQRDIRVFFGDYREAIARARELLFEAGDSEIIAKACTAAAEKGIGWLEEGQSLQLHSSLVPQLSPVLRVYVNCGLQLYGDFSSADLIKIHFQTGKLTLMSFDDFIGKPLPRMLRRIKVRLRDLDLDSFEYGGEYAPPYLYRKSRFINEEFANFAEQLQFEEALEQLHLFNFEGYGPAAATFDAELATARWEIDGFRLIRSRTLPDLDAPCGRYFTYRHFIECGESQAKTKLANLPKEPESYNAVWPSMPRSRANGRISSFASKSAYSGFVALST